MPGQKREARLRAGCPGHLRLSCFSKKGVDGRDKPGHDGKGKASSAPQTKIRRAFQRAGSVRPANIDQADAARGARLRELRWKNSAWLATAETIAGWNGFEIRNAGSGRSPVRKRSG